jgi:arylformamidase
MADETTRDDAWFEAEYNPRLTVADVDQVFAGWVARSAALRAEAPPQEVRYGSHAREVLDWFRPARPRGLVVFLHGGYWRALSKAEHSFVAAPWLASGYSVAVINYPLCPEVRIVDIVASCRRAVAALWPSLAGEERGNAIVAGHSAGGYLTAAMLATDWAAEGLPGQPFRGGLALSGVFMLEPLLRTSMNGLIRLAPEEARGWSLDLLRPGLTVPLLFAVGGDEPSEFHRQSRALAAAWALPGGGVCAVAGRNHFTIVEDFARAGSLVKTLAAGLLSR